MFIIVIFRFGVQLKIDTGILRVMLLWSWVGFGIFG